MDCYNVYDNCVILLSFINKYRFNLVNYISFKCAVINQNLAFYVNRLLIDFHTKPLGRLCAIIPRFLSLEGRIGDVCSSNIQNNNNNKNVSMTFELVYNRNNKESSFAHLPLFQ